MDGILAYVLRRRPQIVLKKMRESLTIIVSNFILETVRKRKSKEEGCK